MLIRLVIQIIYISWNRNIKRKIIIFNCTKLWFYVQIKYLIKDHCTDQVQKAKTVLSAVSLIFVISIGLFYLSLFHRVMIYWSLSIEQVRTCNLISHICMHVFMYVCMRVLAQCKCFWVEVKLAIVMGSRSRTSSWIEAWLVWS